MARANKKNQKSKSPKNAPKRDAKGQFAKKSAASDTPKSKASEAKSYGPGEGKKDDGSDVIGILRITRTEESATGSTSKTTTYNIKSDGTREKVDEYEEGSKNCNPSEPQGKDCLVPVLQAIEAHNPPKIIVGGHPYFSEKYVEDAKKAAARDATPSFAELAAGLQRVSVLHEQCKRLRRRELAKKLAQVSSKVIMWGLSLGLVALASVGIYTLGMHAIR